MFELRFAATAMTGASIAIGEPSTKQAFVINDLAKLTA